MGYIRRCRKQRCCNNFDPWGLTTPNKMLMVKWEYILMIYQFLAVNAHTFSVTLCSANWPAVLDKTSDSQERTVWNHILIMPVVTDPRRRSPQVQREFEILTVSSRRKYVTSLLTIANDRVSLSEKIVTMQTGKLMTEYYGNEGPKKITKN